MPFLGHTLLWKAVFTFWNCAVSSSKACRKHFRVCWAWFRLKEGQIQAQISMADQAFCFFAQWRIPFPGCRYNERLSMRSLITAIGCCPHNLGKQSVSSKERGVLTSCMLLLLYEIFIPWIDPLPHWVKCLELLISFQSLCCTNAGTDTLLRLLMNKVSLILMWLYLQQGRKYYLHPPVLKNLGTFFQSMGFGLSCSWCHDDLEGSLWHLVLLCLKCKFMGTPTVLQETEASYVVAWKHRCMFIHKHGKL